MMFWKQVRFKRLGARFLFFGMLSSLLYFLTNCVNSWKESVFLSLGDNRQIVDYPMLFFSTINDFLNKNLLCARICLLFSELILVGYLLFIVFRGLFFESLRQIIGILIGQALRTFCLWTTVMPKIPGILYFNPGIPSLTMYEIMNDHFFSGHMVSTVFGALLLGRVFKTSRFVRPIQIITIGAQLLFMYALRLHYTIDVFAGVLVALWLDSWIYTVPWPAPVQAFFEKWNLEPQASDKS